MSTRLGGVYAANVKAAGASPLCGLALRVASLYHALLHSHAPLDGRRILAMHGLSFLFFASNYAANRASDPASRPASSAASLAPAVGTDKGSLYQHANVDVIPDLFTQLFYDFKVLGQSFSASQMCEGVDEASHKTDHTTRERIVRACLHCFFRQYVEKF